MYHTILQNIAKIKSTGMGLDSRSQGNLISQNVEKIAQFIKYSGILFCGFGEMNPELSNSPDLFIWQ